MKSSFFLFLVFLLALFSCSRIAKNIYNRTVSRDSLISVNRLFNCKGDSIPYTGNFYEKYDSVNFRLKGSMDSGRLHGGWTEYYVNGKVKFQCNYNKGIQTGISEDYYENGCRRSEILYDDNGKKNGVFKQWHEDGRLEIKGAYLHGVRKGVWKYFGAGEEVFEKNYPEEILQPVISYNTVNLKTEADILTARERMIRHIWGDTGWPVKRTIDSVVRNISYKEIDSTGFYKTVGNLKQIDRYYVKMPNNFVSLIHHFRPRNSNGKVFIYHAGHGQTIQRNVAGESSGLFISEMIKDGYDVVSFMMPAAGNPRPMLHIDGYKDIDLNKCTWPTDVHDLMFTFLDQPYRYFLEPIVAAINYLEKVEYFHTFYMAGISGGGWTTTVYSALDPRIQYSFQIAGTVPLELRTEHRNDRGDAEQGYDHDEYDPAGLFDIVNFKDMYVMGAAGEERMQVQLLNEFDDCCFAGTRYIFWINEVKEAVAGIGKGRYNFYLDQSHQIHKISPEAVGVIRAAVKGSRAKQTNPIPTEIKSGDKFEFQPKVERSGVCDRFAKFIWSMPVKPSWMKIDRVSGLITGQPSAKGSYYFSFKAVDGKGDFIIESAQIEVK